MHDKQNLKLATAPNEFNNSTKQISLEAWMYVRLYSVLLLPGVATGLAISRSLTQRVLLEKFTISWD
jgi:hypothetical protein